jgi:hypothetical protein
VQILDYNKVTYDPETRTISDVIKWRDPTVRKAESYLLGAQFFAYGVKSNYTVKSAAQWPFDVLRQGERILALLVLQLLRQVKMASEWALKYLRNQHLLVS